MSENKTFVKAGGLCSAPVKMILFPTLQECQSFPHLLCIRHFASSYPTSFSMNVLLIHACEIITIKSSSRSPVLAPYGF